VIYFWGFLGFVILQRLIELVIAKRNAKVSFSKDAVEIDAPGYKYIVLMHTLFLISLILEKLIIQPGLNFLWYLFLILFLIAQFLRYWSIVSLGDFWNTRILIVKGSKLVKKGPYKFFAHPNYLAVITEIAVIPLIFSCYITAIVFSILNIFILSRRVKIEDNALREFCL
jgi:methyltransferase